MSSNNMEGAKFYCGLCDKPFTMRRNVYQHQRTVHKIQTQTGSLRCQQVGCGSCFRTLADIRLHLAQTHKEAAFLNKTEKTFQSVEDFMIWKKQEEAATTSLYIARRTPQHIARSETKKQIFYCHRSGQYKSKGKGMRTMKAQGTCKINSYCLSTIEVEYHPDGSIKLVYWSEHYGHTKDLAHIPISDSERAEIAGKLRQGASLSKVLDDVRSNFGGSLERIHFLTRKDLHNIRRDFRLLENKQHKSKMEKPQENIAADVDVWVERLNDQQDDSPILFYKSSCCDEGTNFMDDDFILVLMTSTQKEMMQKFGSDRICIDSLHGANACDYHVTTAVVIDEFGAGFPVAFCISGKVDLTQMIQFFNAIEMNVGEVKTSVFTSDDVAVYYNAWKMVMGEADEQSTNSQQDTMHRTLKSIYFEGKKVKPITKCLDALMKLSRDKTFERMARIWKQTTVPVHPSEETKPLGKSLGNENRKKLKLENVDLSITQKINCCIGVINKKEAVQDDLKLELDDFLEKWLSKVYSQKTRNSIRKDSSATCPEENQVLVNAGVEDTKQNSLNIIHVQDHCYVIRYNEVSL